MAAKVFIIHGYTGTPEENWFPWLKDQLSEQGIEVFTPQMPHSDKPRLNEWLAHLEDIVGPPDENTYLVGHSLGCATILRYLESLKDNQRVAAALLVAGFAEPIHFTELNEFTLGKWDDDQIKRASKKFIFFNSDNDPHVPMEMGERLQERFGGELIKVNNAGHFNIDDGYTTLPIVLDKLDELMYIS